MFLDLFLGALIAPSSNLGVEVRLECVTAGGGVVRLPLFQVLLKLMWAMNGMGERFGGVGRCQGEPGGLSGGVDLFWWVEAGG